MAILTDKLSAETAFADILLPAQPALGAVSNYEDPPLAFLAQRSGQESMK
jgi:hypothetical protein